MNFMMLLTTNIDTAAESGGLFGGSLSTILLIGVMVVVFYFLMIRPQRKRDKQAKEQRSNLEVGDGVTTIGGVVGRVVSIKDDTFLLETGSDRTKIRFQKFAIQDVEKLKLDE